MDGSIDLSNSPWVGFADSWWCETGSFVTMVMEAIMESTTSGKEGYQLLRKEMKPISSNITIIIMSFEKEGGSIKH